jgi:hypothetical protein
MMAVAAAGILSIAFYKVGVLSSEYIGRQPATNRVVPTAMTTPMEMKGEHCMYDSCIAAPSTSISTANLFEGTNHRERAAAYFDKVIESLTATAKERDKVDNHCGLYLAPSTLPHAGLGLFSGFDIPHRHSINEYIGGTFPEYDDDKDPPLWTDLFIPIVDDYKALPYRGQQRFPSWLQYIWPKHHGALSDLEGSTAFPGVPHVLWDFDLGLNFADGVEFYAYDEDGQRDETVNAFMPGLASLANSHVWFSNMDRIYENTRVDYNGQTAPWQPGAGPFTPHHDIEFYTSKKVHAGMELVSIIGDEITHCELPLHILMTLCVILAYYDKLQH